MILRKKTASARDEGLQMTSMIDVVFLLLIFFMLTFKIMPIEGDFTVMMPPSADELKPLPQAPLKIRIKSDSRGEISSLSLAGEKIPGNSFDTLHNKIVGHVGGLSGPGKNRAHQFEVELDCDYKLKYDYVIKAITAATGHVKGSGPNPQIIKLIETIKFAPIKKSAQPASSNP